MPAAPWICTARSAIAAERLGHEGLDHRDLLAVGKAVLDLPRGVQHHQPRRVEVDRAVGDHEACSIWWRASCLPNASRSSSRWRCRSSARCDTPIQRIACARRPPARRFWAMTKPSPSAPSRLPRRDAHVVERDDRVAAGRVRAHPLRVALDLPAGRVGRDEDQRVVAVAGGLVGPGLRHDDANAAPFAPVMHHLRPLMTHSPSSRTAVVSRFVGSLLTRRRARSSRSTSGSSPRRAGAGSAPSARRCRRSAACACCPRRAPSR